MIKKITIKGMKIKINFIFDWKVKLKRKINLAKGLKKSKDEDPNWHKISSK